MKKLTIEDAKIVTQNGILDKHCVLVEDGIITDIYPNCVNKPLGKVVCADGLYLSAGFIDIHVHGGGGSDFMDATADAFNTALLAHMSHGTTSIVPTTLTSTIEELQAVFHTFKQLKNAHNPYLPNLLGLHLEGPYIAASMKGAQDEKYIGLPKEEEYNKIIELAENNLLIWTLAPELPGMDKLCQAIKGKGIFLSAGHSEAQYDDMLKAVENGFTMATHLYSAMSTIVRENGFRKLGLIESSLLLDQICVEIIADGKHLPPELIKLVMKTKSLDKIVLVTDAMRGAGMPDGKYILGSLKQGQMVMVTDNIARMPDGISFAGSVATADLLLRVMTKEVGVSLFQAVQMLTVNPAKQIGIFDKKGSVSVGKDADMVLFDDGINIKSVFIAGQEMKK